MCFGGTPGGLRLLPKMCYFLAAAVAVAKCVCLMSPTKYVPVFFIPVSP